MSELEIPNTVYHLATEAAREWAADLDTVSIAAKVVDAISPLIVASELRRLAIPYGEREDICAGDRDRLLARADELDPEVRTRIWPVPVSPRTRDFDDLVGCTADPEFRELLMRVAAGDLTAEQAIEIQRERRAK